MDLQQIKYFLAVVDSGTFLAASKNVHVSQPTLSAGIRKLEESLNVTLFNRGSRSATLTPAGEQFLGPARQAFNQLLTIKSQLKAQPEKIVIGVLKNIHMDHVAKIISTHRATHPHILIELVVGGNDELSQMLKERKVDLIIVNSNTTSDNFTSLISEQLCVVVSAQHPLAKENAIELSALQGELFIERVKCDFWVDVHQALHEQGIEPHTVMQAESDEFVLSLVSANLGVSVITDRATPYDVRFIPIKDVSIDRSIGIGVTDNTDDPHVQEFLAVVLRRYQ